MGVQMLAGTMLALGMTAAPRSPRSVLKKKTLIFTSDYCIGWSDFVPVDIFPIGCLLSLSITVKRLRYSF